MLRPRLLLSIGLVAAVALTACSGDEPVAATSTTGTALPSRTSVPRVPIPTTTGPGTTTTTIPAEIATSIDACALLAPAEVEALIGGDPGPGREIDTQGQDRDDPDGTTTSTTPTTVASPGSRDEDVATAPPPGTTTDPDAAPSLLLSTCAWPTDGPNEVVLTYFAPTTATSSREHLQRLVDRGTRFADGARVFPLTPVEDLAPAALVKDDRTIEVATVRGSALVYITQEPPPTTGSEESERLVSALLLAAARSPG